MVCVDSEQAWALAVVDTYGYAVAACGEVLRQVIALRRGDAAVGADILTVYPYARRARALKRKGYRATLPRGGNIDLPAVPCRPRVGERCVVSLRLSLR